MVKPPSQRPLSIDNLLQLYFTATNIRSSGTLFQKSRTIFQKIYATHFRGVATDIATKSKRSLLGGMRLINPHCLLKGGGWKMMEAN